MGKVQIKIIITELKKVIFYCHYYPVSMSLFCLSHSFVYLLYFCPSRDRS